MHLQAATVQLQRGAAIELNIGEHSSGVRGTGPMLTNRRVIRNIEQGSHRAAPLGEVFSRLPKPQESVSEAEAPFGICGFDEILDGSAEVIMLNIATRQPGFAV